MGRYQETWPGRALALIVTAALALALTPGAAAAGARPAGAPAGYPLDGKDAIEAHCARGARTVSSDEILAAPDVVIAVVDLRYSPRCRAAWARVRIFQELDGFAVVKRLGDDTSFHCDRPARSQVLSAWACYTPMVARPAPLSVRAYGHVRYQGQTLYGRTRPY